MSPQKSAAGRIAEHATLMAVAWPASITAITLPLAVRAFARLSR